MGSVTFNLLGASARLNLQRSQQAIQAAIERVATGKRLNRASDDPSGMVAVESMSAERTALERRLERLELDNARHAAKDGVLGVLGDLYVELDALVVTASNTDGLSNGERGAMQIQADSILDAIDHITATATFGGEQLFAGRASQTMGVIVGAGDGIEVKQDPDDGRVSLASLRSGRALNLIDGDLEKAQEVVKAASEGNAKERAALGQSMKENERRQRLAGAELENLTGAISSIQDADYAREISELMRAQVLEQTSIAAIAIGRRQTAVGLLSLLPR
ncbi:MAG: flagellin [Phycisphaerales bacterium]